MAQVGEDCHFFMTAECREGAACSFRHSDAAKANTTAPPCRNWMQGSCGRLSCSFRHPTLKSPAGRGAPPASFPLMAAMPMAAAMGAGPECKYFLAGNCTKGAACTFRHSFAQMAPLLQLQQQAFAQQQFQQQQMRPAKPRRAVEKRASSPPPPEETPEERRERLLSQPLGESKPGKRTAKAVKPAGTSAVVVQKERAPKKEAPAAQPEQQAKKIKSSPGPGNGSTPAPVIKSLAQIMAEKEGSAAAPVSSREEVVKPNLDDELLALGISPGPPTAKSTTSAAVPAGKVASKVVKKKYDDELLAMGLDPEDL